MFYNMKLKFLNQKKKLTNRITPGPKLYLNEYDWDKFLYLNEYDPFYYSSEHLLPAMYIPIYEWLQCPIFRNY